MGDIQKIIKNFPKTPGIYQFFDSSGSILYIGKAKNLHNRVKSYFAKEIGRGPTIDLMVREASDIKYCETESEIEAILLEADLINKLKPKYNIRLRDDKSFLVIKITKPKSKKENLKSKQNTKNKNQMENYLLKFSCIELVRFKNVDFSDKSAWYFGPYPSGLLLKKTMFYLRKIFPFRDCSKTKFNTYRKKGRPCIYGDIKVCTAPCADWIGGEEYQKNIKFLIAFLRGKKKAIIKSLEKEMAVLSKKREYEKAAEARNKLNGLLHLNEVAVGLRDDFFSSNSTFFPRIECYDISNIGGLYAVGAMVVFNNGKPDKGEYRHFKIRNKSIQLSFQPEARELESRNQETGSQIQACLPAGRSGMTDRGGNDLKMMKQILERRFKNDWPLPNLIVIDGGETHLNVAREVVKKLKLNIPIVSIAKGAKRKKNEFNFSDESIAQYIMKNIDSQRAIISARDEAHRFAISYYRSLHKKGLFE